MSGRRTMRTADSDEKGFALVAALLSIIIMGVFTTGAFFIARQESRIGMASEQGTAAFYMAERGVSDVLSDWDPMIYNSMGLWTARSVADTLDDGVIDVNITRLAARLYFLDATATITRGGTELSGGSRRMGMMARIVTAQIQPPAALTTRGDVTVTGTAEVNGWDSPPASWPGATCAMVPTAQKPGVMTDGSGTVRTQGAGKIEGNPPTSVDPSIGDSTFNQFGDLSYDQLASMANLGLPGNTYGGMTPSYRADGSCNTSDPMNWGDPYNPMGPCGNYFPMIHIKGNAKIQGGGYGQGVLLVDGDLDVRGNFQFYGIVIVQGTFQTQGIGNKITGGVLAGNAIFDDQRLVGNSVVSNSTCAVERALMNNAALARPRPLARRGWVDLSSVAY